VSGREKNVSPRRQPTDLYPYPCQPAARLFDLDAFAERRAQTLLTDHRRGREAADMRGNDSVKALLPPELIALFVLPPKVS
jgi:hypothetical protein